MNILVALYMLFAIFPRDVVYYSQRDDRWGDITLTCDSGERNSFSRRGCGETVFSMLMATYVDPDFTPVNALDEFYGYRYCGGTGYMQAYRYLERVGFVVQQAPVSIGALKSLVNEGWLVWAHAEWRGGVGHELLIVGVEDNKFVVHDPYYGAGVLDGFPYSEEDFTAFFLVKWVGCLRYGCRFTEG